MFELPLFPLNTVLFPHTPVYLHIFEDRYQKMIGECIEKRRPFGVVLIKSGQEALGPLAEPYGVGCTAEIVQVEKLSQGRLNIVALGRERFRILSLDEHRYPYLVGAVEQHPLGTGDAGKLKAAARDLRPWVERYLALLAGSGEIQAKAGDLPEDPLALVYLAAAVLQSPPVQKQPLLEASDAGEMASSLLAMFRRETALLQTIRTKEAGPGKESFSKN